MGGREVVTVGRLTGEEQPLIERTGQRIPCRRLPWKGIAVGAPNVLHAAPVRSRQRAEHAPDIRAEQRRELVDGVCKAGHGPALRQPQRTLAPEEAFDHGTAEGADIVGSGARIARVADNMGLGLEELLPTTSRNSFSSRPSGRLAAA